jgi:hypothetical protein
VEGVKRERSTKGAKQNTKSAKIDSIARFLCLLSYVLRLLCSVLVVAAGGCLGVCIGRLPPHLLALEFLSQFTLEPPLFSGFQKKRVLLHVLNNTFLLDLSLETAKGALNGFALENPDFCQIVPP